MIDIDKETSAATTFQVSTLDGILRVQGRLLELMDFMKESREDEDEDEDIDFQEFEAILDLYRAMTDVLEIKR